MRDLLEIPRFANFERHRHKLLLRPHYTRVRHHQISSPAGSSLASSTVPLLELVASSPVHPGALLQQYSTAPDTADTTIYN